MIYISRKDAINHYGQNGFRIFDLPNINEGSITGIMGRNGIGKSTVISILSNLIKVNFIKTTFHNSVYGE